MSWSFLFAAVNAIALVAWAMLILLPRTDIAKAAIFYAGIGLLCLVYAVLLVLLVTGVAGGDPVLQGSSAGFTSIEGVRGIFLSDGGVVTGWTHYLAFDLFVGLWIGRDADNKSFSRLFQAPFLLLTLVAGPLGLLVWLAIREPAARRSNPRKKLRL